MNQLEQKIRVITKYHMEHYYEKVELLDVFGILESSNSTKQETFIERFVLFCR